jgi:hypothetical protein
MKYGDNELIPIFTKMRADLLELAQQPQSLPIPKSKETKAQLRETVEEHYPDYVSTVVDAITNECWSKGMSASQYRAKYMNSTTRADIDNPKPLTRESFIAETLAPSNSPTTDSQPSTPPKYEGKYTDDPEDDAALEAYYTSPQGLKDAEDEARWMDEHANDKFE